MGLGTWSSVHKWMECMGTCVFRKETSLASPLRGTGCGLLIKGHALTNPRLFSFVEMVKWAGPSGQERLGGICGQKPTGFLVEPLVPSGHSSYRLQVRRQGSAEAVCPSLPGRSWDTITVNATLH